jgi:hypothetical protein
MSLVCDADLVLLSDMSIFRPAAMSMNKRARVVVAYHSDAQEAFAGDIDGVEHGNGKLLGEPDISMAVSILLSPLFDRT